MHLEDASSLGTILSVWAHPDDETYLCGGLMAAARRAGHRVVCVTATRGELGSTDLDTWPNGPELARVRTTELEQALELLGVDEHIWLDYPDGGCEQVDTTEAVERIRAIALDVQPDTVLTFGPDGMTGHGDHISVGAWTQAAVKGIGVPVHCATYTHAFLDEWHAPLEKLGVFMGNQPMSVAEDELSLNYICDDDIVRAKFAAIKAQISQVAPLLAAFDEEDFLTALAPETFRAAPA
jgi:LmbE family N-acetylglucosaminyl deacetylase